MRRHPTLPRKRGRVGWRLARQGVGFVAESWIGPAVRSSQQVTTTGVRGFEGIRGRVGVGGMRARRPRSQPRAGEGVEADEGQRMPDRIRTAGRACLFDERTRSALSMAMVALSLLAVPAQAQSGDPVAHGLVYVETIPGPDAQALAGRTLFFGALIFAV